MEETIIQLEREINNLDLGDHTSKYQLRDLLLELSRSISSIELKRVDNGTFETAQIGVEYYSPDQCGGIYGPIYRQFFTTSLPSDLTSGNNVSKLMDYFISFNHVGTGGNRGVARGFAEMLQLGTAQVSIQLAGASGYNNLILDNLIWTINDGWVDYTK